MPKKITKLLTPVIMEAPPKNNEAKLTIYADTDPCIKANRTFFISKPLYFFFPYPGKLSM